MALNCQGSGYIDLGAATSLLQNVTGGSICAWVNVNNFPAGAGVENYISHFSQNASNTASRLGMSAYQTVTGFRLTARRIDGETLVAVNDTTVRSTGTWYHVAATADYGNLGQGQTLRLYVNGAFVADAGVIATWTGASSNLSSLRGCHGARASQLLQIDGIIDDVRVYSRALSAGEVSTIYTAIGQDGILNGLVNRHLCDGAVSATASGTSVDLSGTLNGTYTASPVFAAGRVNRRKNGSYT